MHYLGVTALSVFVILNHEFYGVFGGQTCGTIPDIACPQTISEHTGELVQPVPKYLTRDHPEYEVRTPPAMRDKVNLYCAHPACNSNPCLNEGTCIEELFGYSCSCVRGYGGTHCEENIACNSNPCLNGGTCTEKLVGYSCSCVQGYGGTHCEENLICPDGWLYATTKCFKVRYSANSLTFGQARVSCSSLPLVTLGNGKTTGPSMIYIESIEEFDKIRHLLDGSYLWNHCKRENGQWKCYRNRNGDLSSYRNWGTNQPENINLKGCALIYVPDGKMHNYDCNQAAAVVCQVII
ncbi:fibropellin-1-like isoform X2 [Lytechinus pictus]|uniref:fibropellin-1-like isoform X2 n=1 Tax=Lytechinus pictus TaxID=7653 RepID=UPI0030BA09B8